VAAQMLAGKGFKEVYNLTGGIKAWNSDTAFGPEELGLDLFDGNESPEETLVVAYSLEEGLREFYLAMLKKVSDEKTGQLFQKLAEIEMKHQDRIFDQYIGLTATQLTREEFAEKIVSPAMEGGLTTEEYLERYPLDLNVTSEIVSMAMAIEAQALDLYQRASDQASNEKNKSFLLQIADEERIHLQQLAKLFETEVS
jgi:rubrerythrin